ncbi:hypothetical protein ACFL4X_00835 [Gemmatimonadota bacterium]
MGDANNFPAYGGLNKQRETTTGTTFTKAQIRDQIKISRYGRLIETCEQIPYFSRIIEEINAGNYPGLLTVSHEFALSLGILNRALDRMVPRVYQMDRMPIACELEALRIMFGPDAGELQLAELGGEKEISDRQVRRLYFALSGSSNIGETMKLIAELKLDALHRYIWEHGLIGFLINRYKLMKGHPEGEISRAEIIDTLSLPAIFDEAMLIQRFTGEENDPEGEGIDIRDQLALESTRKAEGMSRINSVYRQIQAEELDYEKLERAMGDANMDLEISHIQKAGIDWLKEYIRTNAVTGARQIALRYEFVCPTVSSSDLVEAGRLIGKSFFGQAQNSKKGSMFLRSEVLNNLRPFVASGSCHRLPGNYLLALVQTMDGEEHYLICKQNSKLEQDAFNLRLLADFYFFERPQKAVIHLLQYYLEFQSGGIRTLQAFRKLLFASPIVVGLAALVSVLYYIVLAQPGEALLVCAGIVLIGSLIAAKNGYEEAINPAIHQKIPSYISRKNGRVTATTSSLNLSSLAEKSNGVPDDEGTTESSSRTGGDSA